MAGRKYFFLPIHPIAPHKRWKARIQHTGFFLAARQGLAKEKTGVPGFVPLRR